MLSPLEMAAGITAGISGAGLVFGNIKGIFARIESVVIVKANLTGNSHNDFLDYCWDNFKSSRFGVRKYDTNRFFIKPKNRYGRIVYESPGKFITFWDRWKPIFISEPENESGMHISFIRGTFELEKLLIDSNLAADKRRHEEGVTGSRYRVNRVFGKNKNAKEQQGQSGGGGAIKGPSYSSSDDQEVPSARGSGFRPLHYSRGDLGEPTSNNPMANLAYDKNVEAFFEEVKNWKDSEQWFKDRSLPWRFGAILLGPPGTGKSSLAKAIGQSLDMPIDSYDLTTMDNEDFTESWQKSLSKSPCIVLLEDIDRIFDENKRIITYKDKSPLTLDCLLNCLSGVQPAEGILVLVTANEANKLDSALGIPDPEGKSTRPGRLDRAVFIGKLDRNGRIKIAKRILSDTPDKIEEIVALGENETGAQFESRCSKYALEAHWGKFKVYGND